MSAALVVETVEGLEERQATPQDEDRATTAPPLVKSEGRLDWGESALALSNRIRAFHPWPGTWCERGEVALKILAARPTEGSGSPGEVLKTKGQLVVACGEGALEVLEAQLPGKRALPGSVLANGARIGIGEVLS
jgi:methionyl-tRNA formyltransferase